ncbi:MULE domain-containing protein [Aphis craccivora]|uniref:MULE domain-containing protein n=1 Tax=Aphis craccivora TaxID=307492 RepID=A0A6G0YF15_APHCR|nr:MULE domain-containing protein [Aphis craccivora]
MLRRICLFGTPHKGDTCIMRTNCHSPKRMFWFISYSSVVCDLPVLPGVCRFWFLPIDILSFYLDQENQINLINPLTSNRNYGRRLEGPWENGDRETLILIIKNEILPSSIIISDEWRAYSCLKNAMVIEHTLITLDDERRFGREDSLFRMIITCLYLGTCKKNMELLKYSEHVFGSGTFSFAPNHFFQIYTIHVIQNNFYVPLHTNTYIKMWLSLNNICLEMGNKVHFIDYNEYVINEV